jgi:hypothetical protein
MKGSKVMKTSTKVKVKVKVEVVVRSRKVRSLPPLSGRACRECKRLVPLPPTERKPPPVSHTTKKTLEICSLKNPHSNNNYNNSSSNNNNNNNNKNNNRESLAHPNPLLNNSQAKLALPNLLSLLLLLLLQNHVTNHHVTNHVTNHVTLQPAVGITLLQTKRRRRVAQFRKTTSNITQRLPYSGLFPPNYNDITIMLPVLARV